MSNRNTDWHPALQKMRNLAALFQHLQSMLQMYDRGDRIPPTAWELLRERLAKVTKEPQDER